MGQACGANPIPIVVPCHRVLAAGGIGGTAGLPHRARRRTQLARKLAVASGAARADRGDLRPHAALKLRPPRYKRQIEAELRIVQIALDLRTRPRGETVLWRERLARSREERDSREYIAFGADAEQREGRRQYRLIVCACGARALHEAQAGWRAARMRRSWIATTIANRVKPTRSAVVVGYTN